MQPKTIIDLLEIAAKKWPDDVLYENEVGHITFSQTLALAKKVGTQIAAASPANKPILVISDKSIRTPTYYLGVLYAGCFYVPIANDTPVFRAKIILEIVEAQTVLVDEKNEAFLAQLDFKGKVVRVSECNAADETFLETRRVQMCETDPQHIIFTSGSTGKPKGVVSSKRAIFDYVTNFADTFGFNRKTVFGSQAPFEYDAAVRDMFLPICSGGKTAIIPKLLFSKPVDLFNYLNSKKVNTICWVASAFTLIYEVDAFKQIRLPYIKKLFFIGSVMPTKVYYYLRDNMPKTMFVNHYGPTEATASSMYYTLNRYENYDIGIPIGKPFSNRQVFLADGEMYISSACIGNGYYKNREKTEEVYVQNPIHNDYTDIVVKTGDLGTIREDGNFMFHGRKDNMVKHMGHRVELGEIEMVSLSCDGVSECCCLYDDAKNMICLFYSGSATAKEVTLDLRGKLPSYMVPRKLVPFDKLPRLFNGKVDIQALRKSLTEKG